MKSNAVLIGFTVIIFLGIYLVFPYTDMGKEAYETNRNNAVLYIQAMRHNLDPKYQKEVQRLIEKYGLQQWEYGIIQWDFER